MLNFFGWMNLALVFGSCLPAPSPSRCLPPDAQRCIHRMLLPGLGKFRHT